MERIEFYTGSYQLPLITVNLPFVVGVIWILSPFQKCLFLLSPILFFLLSVTDCFKLVLSNG